MKKTTLLNSALSSVVADLGHGDCLVLGDAGLPVPVGVEKIDLAVSPGVPSFLDTLRAVLSELEVERVMIAAEMKEKNPRLHGELQDLFGEKLFEVTHEEFKAASRNARAVVRTGECQPYANVGLYSGVVF